MMRLILRPELSGYPHGAKHRASEYTYAAEESNLILGSLSEALPAFQDLHSYVFLPPGKQITASSQRSAALTSSGTSPSPSHPALGSVGGCCPPASSLALGLQHVRPVGIPPGDAAGIWQHSCPRDQQGTGEKKAEHRRCRV